MALIRPIAALAGLALLSACVSVLPEQQTPSALYRLGDVPPVAELDANLVVREPMAERVLGGQDMVVESADGGLRLIQGVEWAGRLTRLMQGGMIDALSGEGDGIAVPELAGAPGAYELSWRIKDLTLFSGEGGADRAVCALDLTLMEGRSRAPVSQGKVRTEVAVSARAPERRAQALSQVARDCLAEAAVFVSGAVNEAYSPAMGN